MTKIKSNFQTLCLTTQALACALKHRDTHTQLHADRVITLSVKLGKACKLTNSELAILKLSACLHDIGKIGIPDNILLKPDKFNAEEWGVMKSHSEIGADIVSRLGLDESTAVSEAIRHHHENFNGSGYPANISGESIPIQSRIISIADSYDAMREARPYHQPRSHKEVMSKLLDEKCEKYDPYILNKFFMLKKKMFS